MAIVCTLEKYDYVNNWLNPVMSFLKLQSNIILKYVWLVDPAQSQLFLFVSATVACWPC